MNQFVPQSLNLRSEFQCPEINTTPEFLKIKGDPIIRQTCIGFVEMYHLVFTEKWQNLGNIVKTLD